MKVNLQFPTYGIYNLVILMSFYFLRKRKRESRCEWKNNGGGPRIPCFACFRNEGSLSCMNPITKWFCMKHGYWDDDTCGMTMNGTLHALHALSYLWCFLTFDLFILQIKTQSHQFQLQNFFFSRLAILVHMIFFLPYNQTWSPNSFYFKLFQIINQSLKFLILNYTNKTLKDIEQYVKRKNPFFFFCQSIVNEVTQTDRCYTGTSS